MPDLQIKSTPADADGCVLRVTPRSAGWSRVGFEVYQLRALATLAREPSALESCVVLLSGTASLIAGGRNLGVIGERHSPFDGKPWAAFFPAGTAFELTATSDVELALANAPGNTRGSLAARVIRPDDMDNETRGTGSNTRHITNILPETAAADSLLVVEVRTPGGNWSSYPPHKHDRDAPPDETQLEETYYHRINPPQGFAFQRVYTDARDLDQTMCVEDGDCVLVPRGYHPVGAPHGYDLYYLNVMAGPRRRWIFHNDPAHEWLIG